MITNETMDSLLADHARLYADWLKADQAAFEASQKNTLAERTFKEAQAKENYDKRDLLKADPVLGNYMIKQAIAPQWVAWCDAEDAAKVAEQAAKQASIRVNEINRRIEIYRLALV
jgi:hypothetical protein